MHLPAPPKQDHRRRHQLTTTLILCLSLIFAFSAEKTYGGLTSEACLLVVNADSPTSVRVANHYIQLRQIPAQNVVYLQEVPVTERIGFPEYQKLILTPIIKAIQDRKLDRQIDCIVYSTGFPTIVTFGAWFEEAERKPHKIESPYASLTSMTYFYRFALAKSIGIASLEANAYARRTPDVVLKVPFAARAATERFDTAVKLYETEDWDTAAREFGELLLEQPFQYGLAYWQARCLARKGDQEAATKAFMEAVKRGWEFRDYAENDEALQSLQDYSPFQAALKAIKEPFWGRTSPVAFSSRTTWGPNGLPERLENSPHAYLLSCMLGVIDGDAAKVNTESEVIDYLTRSAAADGTHPKGVVYFADHKNVRATTRKPNFDEAVTALEALKIPTQVGKGTLPGKNAKVLGATIGSAKFDWGKSEAQFMPGAIGDNLTSFGAKFVKNGQTTVAEFLRYGAAGAAGTVVEPYAIQNKFPLPLIHAYYARGFTLAESYYMSVAGPFQTLLVGDPLCQPFANTPALDVEGVEALAKVDGTIRLQVKLSNKAERAESVDFYFDGRKVGALKSGNLALDTTRHPDGYHELRFVAVSSDRTRATARFTLPLVFDNNQEAVQLDVKQQDQELIVRTIAARADSVTIVIPGKTLGSLKSSSDSIAIPVSEVGAGPVEFQAKAKFGDRVVASKPFIVNVTILEKETVSQ